MGMGGYWVPMGMGTHCRTLLLIQLLLLLNIGIIKQVSGHETLLHCIPIPDSQLQWLVIFYMRSIHMLNGKVKLELFSNFKHIKRNFPKFLTRKI
jgi:hypothetical protein